MWNIFPHKVMLIFMVVKQYLSLLDRLACLVVCA
jgi:hypothetical protein